MSRAVTRPRISATRKKLSQNFLTDPETARRIIRASKITHNDVVVEIGPGDGMLTRHIISHARRVLAYEKDARYARQLATQYSGDPRIRVTRTDFRNVDAPKEPFRVVANIPFTASTDILRWCLDAEYLTSATLVTQYEFARKYGGDYQRWTKLAVIHWPDTTMRTGERISRDRFFPVPRVDSALLHIRRRPHPLLPRTARAEYRRLVELGFSGVGGSLYASLRRAFPAQQVRAACAAAEVPTDVPVGLVPPEPWIVLYRRLSNTSTGAPGQDMRRNRGR